jgi:RNA polymerase sigma factor (sigma-70 family)
LLEKNRGIPASQNVYRNVTRQKAPVLDENRIIQTYRETVGPLYGYVSRRVGGDVGLAEDLVQETWMRALDTWPARGMPDEPLAWLIKVARNTMVSYFRRIRPESVDSAVLDLEAPGFAAEGAEIASLVSWGLSRLRRAHAEVLEAFYFDGKSVRDIARERSLSERAVEGRLWRARVKLKKKLERIVRPRASQRRRAAKGRNEHAGDTSTS